MELEGIRNVCSCHSQGDMVVFVWDLGAEGSLCSCLHLPEYTLSYAGVKEGREGVGPGSNVIDSRYSF